MANTYSLRKGDRVAIVATFVEEIGEKYRVKLVGAEKVGFVDVPKKIARLLERSAYPGDKVLLPNGLKGTYFKDLNETVATVLLEGGDESDPGSYIAVQKATLFAEDQTGANRFASVKREGDEEHRQSRIAQEREIQEISENNDIKALASPDSDEHSDVEISVDHHEEELADSESDENQKSGEAANSPEMEVVIDEDVNEGLGSKTDADDEGTEESDEDGDTYSPVKESGPEEFEAEAVSAGDAEADESEKPVIVLTPPEATIDAASEEDSDGEEPSEDDIVVALPHGFEEEKSEEKVDYEIRRRHREREGYPAISQMIGGIAKSIDSETPRARPGDALPEYSEEEVENPSSEKDELEEDAESAESGEAAEETGTHSEMTPERAAHLEQLRKNMLEEIGIKPAESEDAKAETKKPEKDEVEDILSAIDDLDKI